MTDSVSCLSGQHYEKVRDNAERRNSRAKTAEPLQNFENEAGKQVVKFLARLGVAERAVAPFLSLFREIGGENLYKECSQLARTANVNLPEWSDAIDFIDTAFDDFFTKPMEKLLSCFRDGVPSIVGTVKTGKYFPRTVRAGGLRERYVFHR